MAISLRHLIVGSPLRTAEQAHERLTKTKALAIFSSDALSSVAYATEERLSEEKIANAFVFVRR